MAAPPIALISGKVEQAIDCGTHMLYIALVTEARKLSDAPSMTYAYYFANVKPKPQPKPAEAKPRRGFVCRICGYFYEGDELPRTSSAPCASTARPISSRGLLIPAPPLPPTRGKGGFLSGKAAVQKRKKRI